MARLLKLICIITAVGFFCSGCALMFNGSTQQIPVTSVPDTAKVKLDGNPAGVTPTTITVSKDGSHTIRVEAEGYFSAEYPLSKSVGGWFLAGLVLVGPFEFVSFSNGAAYNLYPEAIAAYLDKR